jgi:hypothetical protein
MLCQKGKLFLLFQAVRPAKIGEVWTLGRTLIWISKFGRLKILKKSEKRRGSLVSHSGCLNGSRRSPMHACDTACGDAVVAVRHRWPPPHVVVALCPHEIEQRKVSPISPSSTCLPRHRSTLSLSAVEALSAPAASVRCWDLMLRPRALPSRGGARRPHHQHPQLLLCAPITSSPSPPFLRELTDNRLLWPSPGPVSASASTTPPRSTSAPTPSPASPASSAPHRRSPMPDRHHNCEPSSGSPLPVQPPIGSPSAPARTPA